MNPETRDRPIVGFPLAEAAGPFDDADCNAGRCDYYWHYLSYGPAILDHDGYHAAMDHCLEAQNLYLAHLDSCKLCNTGYIDSCSQEKRLSRIARSWEERVRA